MSESMMTLLNFKMEKIMSKKVALYCHVSTGNQSTGLEAQVRALRDYCDRNSISDYVIYEDENQSEVKQSRPSLDRMMKHVREGLIGKVIAYSFSRYARSVTLLLRALEEFRKMNVGFVSITESINTNTPLGAAVFTILGAAAQLERDLIAERVRNGLANAKAKGVRIGRLKTRDSDLIRKLRASGMTYRQIATISKCSAGAVSAELLAMEAEKARTHAQASPAEASPQVVKEVSPSSSTIHEIEMPYGEIKLELDFAS
jgi:DNA invertase Pin-like site-specific DNA recombinase